MEIAPEYLVTKEFFADLRRCLGRRGVVVMNAFLDSEDDVPNRRLLATVASAFPTLYAFQRPDINAFVVATASTAELDMTFSVADVPPLLGGYVQLSLETGRRVPPGSLRGIAPLTDRQNLYAHLLGPAKLRRRRLVVENFPARALVN